MLTHMSYRHLRISHTGTLPTAWTTLTTAFVKEGVLPSNWNSLMSFIFKSQI